MNRIPRGVIVALGLFGCGGSGNSDSSTVKLECRDHTSMVNPSERGCDCSAFTNGYPSGTVACSKARFPGTLCCADANWPTSGTSCSCLTLEDGSKPTSCSEIQVGGETLPKELSACDLKSAAP